MLRWLTSLVTWCIYIYIYIIGKKRIHIIHLNKGQYRNYKVRTFHNPNNPLCSPPWCRSPLQKGGAASPMEELTQWEVQFLKMKDCNWSEVLTIPVISFQYPKIKNRLPRTLLSSAKTFHVECPGKKNCIVLLTEGQTKKAACLTNPPWY